MPADEITDAMRHADNQRRLAEVEVQLARLDARSQETLDGVDAIKALISQIDIPSLREVVDAVNTMKGGIRVLGWLERPAKWAITIAGAAAAIYGLWKLK